MRPIVAFLLLATILGTVTPALAVGIDVDRVRDGNIYLCPSCGKVIRTGHIGENAELLLADALKRQLSSRGIPFAESTERAGIHLAILIYRFEERRGGNLAVDRPASVGFHAHLYNGPVLVKTAVFDETQEPLSDNILRFPTFMKRGGRWITVEELAREGVEKVLDTLEKDLR